MGIVSMGFKFYAGKDSSGELITLDTARNIREVTVFNGNYTTKIEFTEDEILALNNNNEVWIEVYVSKNGSTTGIMTDGNKLTPRIQLNAVPYALAVRGVYYDALNDIVKLGEGYQSVTANYPYTNTKNIQLATINDNRRGGLVIQGQVGICTANPTSNARLHVAGDVAVTGNVFVPSGWVSANKVYGAVWN